VIKSDLLSLSKGVKSLCENQRDGIFGLKKEVLALKESHRVQFVNLKSCFDQIMLNVSTLNEQTSKIDDQTKGDIVEVDKKVSELKATVSSQHLVTKQVAENLDRVSKQFGIFREKTNRDSAKFDSEIREIGDVGKSLVSLTSEALPRIESSLSEHWNCIEGLSANVNTIDETLGKNFNFFLYLEIRHLNRNHY
jgi:hypothetical protein